MRRGRPPTAQGEISLSQMRADDLKAGLGGTVAIRSGDTEQAMRVVGVYSDITNGGRSAKAVLPAGAGTPLWTTIPVDVRAGVEPRTVVDRYAQVAAPARVADVESARTEMLGPVMDALRRVSLAAVVCAAGLVVLLSSLLLRLFLVRATARRSVLQAMGVPQAAVREEFATRLLVPVVAGVLLGAVLAAPLGSVVLRLVGSVIGAPALLLRSDPLLTWGVVPLVLIAAAAVVVPLVVRRVPGPVVARVIAGGEA